MNLAHIILVVTFDARYRLFSRNYNYIDLEIIDKDKLNFMREILDQDIISIQTLKFCAGCGFPAQIIH